MAGQVAGGHRPARPGSDQLPLTLKGPAALDDGEVHAGHLDGLIDDPLQVRVDTL